MYKILVPMAYRSSDGQALNEYQFARTTYIQKLVAQGLTPVFVSYLFPLEDIKNLYQECVGVLCMGGSDWDPGYYQAEKQLETEPSEPRRDALESSILQWVLAERKPYLGICRGSQGLAVASGGSLWQHVPSQVTAEHHDVGAEGTYADLPHNIHPIHVTPGTRASQIFDRSTLEVNSAHHQAVKTLGPGFQVSAMSPEGITEMIEATDSNWFCVGIQCHPEAMEGESDRLFAAFAEAVKEGEEVRVTEKS
jgi:putative glutamine amidotransferase